VASGRGLAVGVRITFRGGRSSSEDVILSKLRWHRAAPAQERQFQDVVEVYEIQEPYLEPIKHLSVMAGARQDKAPNTTQIESK
jgi:hypothetical protein